MIADGQIDVVICATAEQAKAVRKLSEVVAIVVTVTADDAAGAVAAQVADADHVAVVDDDEPLPESVIERTVEQAARRNENTDLVRALAQIDQTVYVTDLHGRFRYVNETFCRVYGYRPEDVVGRPAAMIWSGDGPHELMPIPSIPLPAEPATRDADDPEGAGESGECMHRSQSGHVFPVLLTRSPIRDPAGRVSAWVAAVHDLTERKAREEALRESEERYALAAAGANDGLWDWDLRSGRAHFSSRWKLLLGYPDDEIGNRLDAWTRLVHPDDREHLEAALEAHIEGESPQVEIEHRLRGKDGTYRWMISRGLGVRDRFGKVYRIAGSMRDVTDRRQTAERLNRAALHDPLTDLPNRTLFMDRLSQAVRRARRRDSGFGVIFLDLDAFKRVNDELGHPAGDQVLRAVARRLATCLREGDTVARLGGDEFAILLERLANAEHARQVALRAARVFEKPIRTSGVELDVDASIGIAIADPNGPRYELPEEILRDADTAMYLAKTREGTRHVLFAPSMSGRPSRGPDLERELEKALERDQLTLHYQPILDLGGRVIRGFEAFVRWQHPEHGLLPPSAFLPAAVDIGLTIPMGRWALDQALERIAHWRRTTGDPLVITVNLDVAQLASEKVATAITEGLASRDLPGDCLELDISESIVMLDGERVAGVLDVLNHAGIGLAVDDFGTSASSIGQLSRLPIDTIKIDRTLVSRIGIDERELVIVRAIANLARQLGLAVAAEGVESLEQLALLRSLGCERWQGFLFSQAVSAKAAEAILERGTVDLPRVVVRDDDQGDPTT